MTGVKRQNTVVETTSAVHPTQSGSSGISGLVLFCFWWCCSCVYVCGNIDTGIDSSSMLTDTWPMSIQTSKVHLTLWSQIQSTLPSPKESTIQFNRTYHLPTTRPQTGDSQRPTVAIINAIAQNYLIMQLSLYSLIDSLFELNFFFSSPGYNVPVISYRVECIMHSSIFLLKFPVVSDSPKHRQFISTLYLSQYFLVLSGYEYYLNAGISVSALILCPSLTFKFLEFPV